MHSADARTRSAPPILADSPCDDCTIRTIAICGSLPPDDLARLRAIATIGTVPAGGAVFHEGDPAQHLSNVIEGSVRLYKLLANGRRQITGFLFPGDFLGVALKGTYAYSAEAITPLRLCRFSRPQLDRLITDMPKLEHRLLEDATDELVLAQDQMLLLGRKSARERLASFLVSMAKRIERRGRPAGRIELPMSRADIADYLGLTTETVSRTFTQFKRAGSIELPERGWVTLARRERLEELAQGN